MNIRGDLMEKSGDLILKFGYFGNLKEYCPNHHILPIVHGDTLVAGMATLSWVFGLGQKVGQNEAGLQFHEPENCNENKNKSDSK